MEMKNLLIVAGVVCVASIPDTSVADEILRSNEIVVTAPQLRATISSHGRAVSVIDQDDWVEGNQQISLDELLRHVPGLYMQNPYNFAQDLRISLRGYGARSNFGIRGIRVFVDGIPLSLPDGQTQLDSVDLSSIGRIEVLRGPASSLYGNGAGGVILIETELAEKTQSVEGSLATGEYGYQKVAIKSSGLTDKADYLLSLSNSRLEGYREHSEAKGTTLNSKLSFYLTDSDELTLIANHTDQPLANDPGSLDAIDAGLNPASANPNNVLYDAGEALDQQMLSLLYRTNRFGGDLLVRNYYVWRNFANKLPFTSGGSVQLDRLFSGVGVQYSPKLEEQDRLKLTYGVDLEDQDDNRQRFDNNTGTLGNLSFDQREQVSSQGVFIHGEFNLDTSWSVLSDIRYDEVSFDITDNYLSDGDDSGRISFDHLSASVSLNYVFHDTTLFTTLSNAFETPTTTELANPDGSGGLNTTLQSTISKGVEFGYKLTRPRQRYEVSIFSIDLENELVPFEVAGQPGRTFYNNAGSSTRNGMEASMSIMTGNNSSLNLAYTWSNFKFDNYVDQDGNDFSGNQIPGLPEHYAYLGFSFRPFTGLQALYEMIYSGKLYANNNNDVLVEDYFVSNIRLNYSLRKDKWIIKPYLGVNNLFDESYNSNIRINAFGGRYYEPAPLRNVYIGLTANLDLE
jgi:iron complex outermembrane receptor protein